MADEGLESPPPGPGPEEKPEERTLEPELEALRQRILREGGLGKAEVFRIVPGSSTKQKEGELGALEVMNMPDRIGESFGGGLYEVDFRKPNGTYFKQGIRYAFSQATYGPPGRPTLGGHAVEGERSQVEGLLREEISRQDLVIKDQAALIRDLTVNKASGGAAGQVREVLAVLKECGIDPARIVATPAGSTQDPRAAAALDTIMKLGLERFSGRGGELDAPGNGGALGQTLLEFAKAFAPALAGLATRGKGRRDGGPEDQNQGKDAPPAGGNGGGQVAETKLRDEDRKSIAAFIGPALFAELTMHPGLTVEDARAKVYNLIPKEQDEYLYAFCSAPDVGAFLAAELPLLRPHVAFLDNLAASIRTAMKSAETPAV